MVDQTTISVENVSNLDQNGDVVVSEVPNEMSVSITQMPVQVLPLKPSSSEMEKLDSSSEMLTSNIPIGSEEHETTSTQVTIKSDSSEETITMATVEVTESMTTKMESTVTPTTIPTESESKITMKAETSEEVTETMMTTKMATELMSTSVSIVNAVHTTIVPIESETTTKIESNEILEEVTKSSVVEVTEIMVTNKMSDKSESNMVDTPTTIIPMKSESTENKLTETSMPTFATNEMTTKVTNDQTTELTTVTTHQPHIESTSNKMEHEQSTKYHSLSTAELVKEQASDTITEKPSKSSSSQIVISNLIWISILLIIFG